MACRTASKRSCIGAPAADADDARSCSRRSRCSGPCRMRGPCRGEPGGARSRPPHRRDAGAGADGIPVPALDLAQIRVQSERAVAEPPPGIALLAERGVAHLAVVGGAGEVAEGMAPGVPDLRPVGPELLLPRLGHLEALPPGRTAGAETQAPAAAAARCLGLGGAGRPEASAPVPCISEPPMTDPDTISADFVVLPLRGRPTCCFGIWHAWSLRRAGNR